METGSHPDMHLKFDQSRKSYSEIESEITHKLQSLKESLKR